MNPNINCKGMPPPNGLLGYNGGSNGYGAPGMFSGGYVAYDFSRCEDGTSNTFLVGETLPAWNTFDMYFASHMHIGGINQVPNAHKLNTAPFAQCTAQGKPVNARIDTCYAHMGGFKSQHPGGLQMALTDGSGHFISETIDYPTWCFLGDKADKQPVSGL